MATRTRLLLAFQVCVVLGMATSPAVVGFSSSGVDRAVGNPYASHEYKRFGEVMKQCKSFLSWSAAEVDFDDSKADGLKPELSFEMGDWAQDAGDAPLMPFDGSYGWDDPPRPLQLASFTLKHVDPARNSRYALNVSGALAIGILVNGAGLDTTQSQSPEFRFSPGDSELVMFVEGIYVESKKNGGEKILCLLGDAMLPSRRPDSADPWEWTKRSGSENRQPPLLQDDQILLVLRYPKVFTLTSRAVRGELRSLNNKGSLRYFDSIQVSTQLGPHSRYRFGSEEIVSKACSPYPYRDDVVDHDRFEVYKGAEFCGTLDHLTYRGPLVTVVPNWDCNSTDDYCSKLGPFATERSIRATDGGFANVTLLMQDIRCEPRIGKEDKSSSAARVSAVFRAVPPSERQQYISRRTGLNDMTLSAEGIWDSSAGQLCMVGCTGHGHVGCHSRICLYIPTSFSINQRSVIYGRIYSINDDASHFPLSFEMHMIPSEMAGIIETTALTTYKYSRINLAGALLERSEPFDLGKMIRKSLLSYPTKANADDDMINLSQLANELTFHTNAVPDPLSNGGRTGMTYLHMEVLSLGSLMGRYLGYRNPNYETPPPPPAKDIAFEEKLLLNVSAELALNEVLYSNASELHLEGLYNPVDGIMYLLGCRRVRASWKVLSESMDLEGGLDCLVEARVEYPPTTARWLLNPTAKVSITSRRNDDDPLHFSAIKLQTLPILYAGQRQDIMSRRGIEVILRILTLSMAISFILGQLSYIRDNSRVVPYISLVMLGVQALGFSIPLIIGVEALFSRIESESYAPVSLEFGRGQLTWAVNYLVKALVLAALLLTLRLGQKVWKSRIRLLARTPLEPGRVPNDRKVLLISLGLHVIGFLLVLMVHLVNTSRRPAREETYFDPRGNSRYIRELAIQLEEYIGLIQDLFLLPQVIGNVLWHTSCTPLRRTYYVGITVVRILPHVYDFLRAPVFDTYLSVPFELNPSLDFYSNFGDIAIPVVAAFLALVVYVQQRWNYEKLNQTVRSGQRRLVPFGSRVYERLPSASFESELASGVNAVETQDELQKDEER